MWRSCSPLESTTPAKVSTLEITRPCSALPHRDVASLLLIRFLRSTPMRANDGLLDGSDERLYEYIVQHFIATISYNCKYKNIDTTFTIGKEVFSYKGPSFSL